MGSLPHVVEDLSGILKLHSDGSVFRLKDISFDIPILDDGSVLYTHSLYDPENGLHLTIYKPKIPKEKVKLPILVFFHGGGYCVGSRTWPNFHNYCLHLSASLQTVVISPDYRLAPEHRLPAAIDDGLAVLRWMKKQALAQDPHPWLSGAGVDFGRVFVVGDSSGGNLAHHLAVGLGSGFSKMAPVRVRGYVLLAPFFGGTVRTRSELGPPEGLLNLDILDRLWRLSLPEGETADHPYANPFGSLAPNLEAVMLDPVLVIVGGDELLKDRVHNYTMTLKEFGKKIDYVEFEGEQHDFFINDPYSKVADNVTQLISNFMFENSNKFDVFF